MKQNLVELFPPILAKQIIISLSELEIDNIRNWCLETGYRKGSLTTTLYGPGAGAKPKAHPDEKVGHGCKHPHEVDWLQKILCRIAPIEDFLSSWVQVYDLGGFNPMHNHIGDRIGTSGCLFLTKGSSTHFQNPLHPNVMVSLKVEPGHCLMWDNTLFHYSPPSSEERIILAFNLRSQIKWPDRRS